MATTHQQKTAELYQMPPLDATDGTIDNNAQSKMALPWFAAKQLLEGHLDFAEQRTLRSAPVPRVSGMVGFRQVRM
jgi:hypothetical protein